MENFDCCVWFKNKQGEQADEQGNTNENNDTPCKNLTFEDFYEEIIENIMREGTKLKEETTEKEDINKLDKLESYLKDVKENSGIEVLEDYLNKPIKENISSPTLMHIFARCFPQYIDLLTRYGGNLANKMQISSKYFLFPEHVTVLDDLFHSFVNPEKEILALLDKRIIINKTNTNENQLPKDQTNTKGDTIELDFKVFTPTSKSKKTEVIAQLAVTSESNESLLILNHPLIEAYIHKIWKKHEYYFYAYVLLQFVYTITLSVYGIKLRSAFVQNKTVDDELISFYLIRLITGVTASIILTSTIQQVCLLLTYKFRLIFSFHENWLNIISTTLAIILSTRGTSKKMFYSSANEITCRSLMLSSISILIAWPILMSLLGRFSSFGYYTLMLITVVKNTTKIFICLSGLLIGFAISFSIQFHENSTYSSPQSSFLKTMAMMIGEFGYEDLFKQPMDNSSNINITKAFDHSNHKTLNYMSNFAFFMFIIIVSISLMNLIIGVAINDVNFLKLNGEAIKIQSQIMFLRQFEYQRSFTLFKFFNFYYIANKIKNWMPSEQKIDVKDKTKTTLKLTHIGYEDYKTIDREKFPKQILDSIFKVVSKKNIKEDKEMEMKKMFKKVLENYIIQPKTISNDTNVSHEKLLKNNEIEV